MQQGEPLTFVMQDEPVTVGISLHEKDGIRFCQGDTKKWSEQKHDIGFSVLLAHESESATVGDRVSVIIVYLDGKYRRVPAVTEFFQDVHRKDRSSSVPAKSFFPTR